jgi:ABC-type multidrug transport system fused ATPase/permease subunit
MQRYRHYLATYLRPQRSRVAMLAVLLLASIGLQLVGPQILRRFIDGARAGEPLETLVALALVFLAFALVQQAAAVGATYVGEDVGWAATNLVRADLALHCLRLDLSFHRSRTPGEMIERIDGDVTNLATFFSQLVIRVVGNVVLLAGVLVLLFREDWRLGAAFGVFALVAFVAIDRVRNVAVPHWTAARQASADLVGFVEERLAGTEDIRASGLKAHVMRRLDALVHERVAREWKGGFMGSIVGSTMWAVFTLAYVVAFVLGGYLYVAGTITLGTVFLIFGYADLLQRPLQQITGQIEQLQRATASIARIDELLSMKSKLPDGKREPPPGALEVTFDRVRFAYDEEVVLDGLSFRLAPGRVLGLLGRTGSGKTTISRLLFRFYDPQKGAVRLGGLDVREARLRELRDRIGVVTQDVQLFKASVRDNLTLFDHTVPDERILAALDQLGLTGWYRALPTGLDSEVSGLSAGEAQLLAFTRVLLRDPGLVILDEASSRLDPVTERLIERAVDRLLAGRTGVVIAHRLSTVERVDEILILEHGRLLEHGPREALAGDPASRFSELRRAGLAEALA